MANLSTKYGGLELKNPIIAASSGLTDNIQTISELEKNGAAAIVLKSLFEEEIIVDIQAKLQGMQSNGFIYPETLEIYEHDDSGEATLKYLELIKKAKKEIGIPIIASVNCLDAEQWTYFPKQIESAGADALELNIFILPSDMNKTSAENESTYLKIIKEVKKQISIPIHIKLSYYFSNLSGFLKTISETGINGLVLFNRFYNPDIDINKLETTSGAILSSPSDIYQSLRWVAIMSERISCDIAASTGVHDAEGAIKQLLAGASAIQIASCLYKHGTEFINTILLDMEKWMVSKGFNDIQSFKGRLSQSKTTNPAVYSRIQFMKYFRSFKDEN